LSTLLSWLFSDPLTVGSKAPDFTAVDDQGHAVKLAALRGKNVVLVFYPADDTSVCTAQLCEFRDHWERVGSRNAVVFGVNSGGSASHEKFRNKFHLPFPLIVDSGQKLAELYNANGLIVKRTVYLIGPDGVIRYAKRGKPSVSEVLAAAV
jgi:thioredoxin-dependent peroxiredoxin